MHSFDWSFLIWFDWLLLNFGQNHNVIEMEKVDKLSKSFFASGNSFVENSRTNLEKSESTVYFDQQEEEEDDTNFVVVSTLVRIFLKAIY